MSDHDVQNSDQAFYAKATDYFDHHNKDYLDNHLRVLNSYIEPALPVLKEVYDRADGNVRFVELGAGTCFTTLLLKKHFPKSSFTCVDISLVRMEQLVNKAAAVVGIDTSKVELVECDFSGGFPFPAGHFDVIVFDASLHHSRNIWFTIEECARILKANGVIAAMHEQYLAPLTAKYALTRLLNSPEVRSGVSENAYLKEQYDYYFKAAGFETIFLPVAPGKWRFLTPLNGLAFSKWTIVAKKSKQA